MEAFKVPKSRSMKKSKSHKIMIVLQFTSFWRLGEKFPLFSPKFEVKLFSKYRNFCKFCAYFFYTKIISELPRKFASSIGLTFLHILLNLKKGENWPINKRVMTDFLKLHYTQRSLVFFLHKNAYNFGSNWPRLVWKVLRPKFKKFWLCENK